jgi:dihydrofolate reductase
MRVSLIVAMARNRVIGCDGKLPWHIPADLAHFKRLTMGKPILMGRKTHQSIGRALPGRRNIVLSRDPAFDAAGVTRVDTLEAGLAVARDSGAEEAMVIGGAEVYRLALPHATRVYLTEVDTAVGGDTLFPATSWAGWDRVSQQDLPADDGHPGVSFVTLERAPPG